MTSTDKSEKDFGNFGRNGK